MGEVRKFNNNNTSMGIPLPLAVGARPWARDPVDFKLLSDVAEGRGDWVALLRDFTGDFNPTLAKAAKDMAKVKAGKETDVKCELCGKPMVIRFGKAGEFLGCSGYPECKNTKEFDRAPDGAVVPPWQELQHYSGSAPSPLRAKGMLPAPPGLG